MSLTKHNHRLGPWADFDVLANRLHRAFSDSGLGNLTYGANWVPPVSVEERGDEILLTAELPGMSGDAVEITLENNVLTISGEKRESREEGEPGGKYHLVERSFGAVPPLLHPAAHGPRRGHHRRLRQRAAHRAPAEGRGSGQPQDRGGGEELAASPWAHLRASPRVGSGVRLATAGPLSREPPGPGGLPPLRSATRALQFTFLTNVTDWFEKLDGRSGPSPSGSAGSKSTTNRSGPRISTMP